MTLDTIHNVQHYLISFILWKEENKTQFTVASRRQILDGNDRAVSSSSQNKKKDDEFFPQAVEMVKKRYQERILKLFDMMVNKYTNDDFMVRRCNVYGEL